MSAAAQRGRGAAREWLQRIRRGFTWLDSPVAAYYLLLGSVTLLTVFGLFMVLSASTIFSLGSGAAEGSDPYSAFKRQAVFTVIGVLLAIGMVFIKRRFWPVLAFLGFIFGGALLAALHSPLGRTINGNRNWLELPIIGKLQPSEFAKVALILAMALMYGWVGSRVRVFKYALLPAILPVIVLSLIMLTNDLGTALVVAGIVAVIWLAAGIPMRLWGGIAAIGLVAVTMGVLFSSNRTGRFNYWLKGCNSPEDDGCYQLMHSKFALADGGWFGVGPGASREKWAWLPEAHNDFIFAIIGEEFGLAGTLSVCLLFFLMGLAFYRIIVTTDSIEVRVLAAGIMAWILLQASINIASVLGLIPVVGVPLPFVSYGGSAMIANFLGIGLVLSFARMHPEVQKALSVDRRAATRGFSTVARAKSGNTRGNNQSDSDASHRK